MSSKRLSLAKSVAPFIASAKAGELKGLAIGVMIITKPSLSPPFSFWSEMRTFAIPLAAMYAISAKRSSKKDMLVVAPFLFFGNVRVAELLGFILYSFLCF